MMRRRNATSVHNGARLSSMTLLQPYRRHFSTAPPSTPSYTSPQITIEDLSKVDIRVAKVMKAEVVEGSKKLMRLELDVGELGQRTVLSGIRPSYSPSQLLHCNLLYVANLAPRKMSFGVSEGMILAASSNDKESAAFLTYADAGAQPGMKVK